MDRQRFDTLIRALTTAAPRRAVLTALTGGLLAASPFTLEADETEAKRNGKRKKKRKSKNKQNDQPVPPTPPAPPDPVTRADAACLDSGGSLAGGDADGRLAQTFTAIASGPLVRADLFIEREAGTFGDYRLQLGVIDNFGLPTNEVLAVTSVANVNVPDGASTVSFSFANPFSVVAGTEYALVLTRKGSDFSWSGNLGDRCAGQAFESPDQTAPFAPLGNVGNEFDFIFTSFVTS